MKKVVLLVLFIMSACVHKQVTHNKVNSVTIGDSPKTSSSVIEVQPEYPGGIPEFYKFIMSKFKQPYKLGYATTVKVYASFVVEKDGSMSNFKIIRDPGYSMGDETLRVLKLCKTKWKPGIINGLPVRAAYNLPLTINIKN